MRDSIDAGLLCYPTFCTLVAALAFFVMGWNLAVINVPEHDMRSCDKNTATLPPCIRMSDVQWGFTVGSFALGAFIGGILADRLQKKFGHRNVLIGNSTFWIIGSIIESTTVHIILSIFGRMIVGVGTGIGTAIASTFVSEIATRKSRGTLGCLNQLALTIGIFLTVVLGVPLSKHWRLLFAFCVIPACIHSILMFWCPNSPHYYMSKGKEDKARKALTRLRPGYNVEKEFDILLREHSSEYRVRTCQEERLDPSLPQVGSQNENTVYGVKKTLRDPFTRDRLLLCLALHVGQQITGINTIIMFSTSIFSQTFGIPTAQKISIGIAALNVAMTMLSAVIVERTGRRMMLLISFCGMALSATLMTFGSLHSSIAMMCTAVGGFTMAFSIGLGPIPFLIIGELAPNRSRSITASLSLAVNWMFNFIIGFAFPALQSALQSYTFVIFASLSAAYALFTWYLIPETGTSQS